MIRIILLCSLQLALHNAACVTSSGLAGAGGKIQKICRQRKISDGELEDIYLYIHKHRNQYKVWGDVSIPRRGDNFGGHRREMFRRSCPEYL